MKDLLAILDYVQEDVLVKIYDATYSKYVTKSPITIEEAEDWLDEHSFVFDSIKPKGNLLIICIETA